MLYYKEGKMICARESCGYQISLPQYHLSYEDLLEENTKLYKRITELEYQLQQVHRR